MKRTYWLMSILTFCIALGCIFLPPRILTLMNEQKLNQVRTEETQTVTLSAQGQLGFAGKIALLTEKMNTGQANAIQLNGGKNYTFEEMEAHIGEELRKLQELGILSTELPGFNNVSMDIYFYLNIENGNESMILWRITMDFYQEETGSIGLRFLVDDETGKIIGLRTLWMDTPWGEAGLAESLWTEEDCGQLAAAWGEYLGCHLIETEEQSGVWPGERSGGAAATDEVADVKKLKELQKAGLSEKEIREKLGLEPGLSYAHAIYRQEEDPDTFTYYFGKDNQYFYIIFDI